MTTIERSPSTATALRPFRFHRALPLPIENTAGTSSNLWLGCQLQLPTCRAAKALLTWGTASTTPSSGSCSRRRPTSSGQRPTSSLGTLRAVRS